MIQVQGSRAKDSERRRKPLLISLLPTFFIGRGLIRVHARFDDLTLINLIHWSQTLRLIVSTPSPSESFPLPASSSVKEFNEQRNSSQRMVSRKSHPKSRNGCANCKKRRIKVKPFHFLHSAIFHLTLFIKMCDVVFTNAPRSLLLSV